MVFFDPMVSALVGWLVSMTSRQAGHFFFEPKGYDHVNDAVARAQGGNQGRLQFAAQGRADGDLGAVAAGALSRSHAVFMFAPWASPATSRMRQAKIWLAVGIGGLLFRTVHLFFIRDVDTGLVWMTKIITDPFNDLKPITRRRCSC